MDHAEPFKLAGLDLEVFPNRNSLIYKEEYGLSSNIRTLIRGTLRHCGSSKSMKALHSIGLLDLSTPKEIVSTQITWVSKRSCLGRMKWQNSSTWKLSLTLILVVDFV